MKLEELRFKNILKKLEEKNKYINFHMFLGETEIWKGEEKHKYILVYKLEKEEYNYTFKIDRTHINDVINEIYSNIYKFIIDNKEG